MIGSLRASHARGELLPFSEGLQAMFAGEDSEEADAAAITLAEVLLLHRKWILSHKEG